MKNQFEVRQACSDDCESIASLNLRLAYETEGKRLDVSIVEKGVQALLTDERHGRYFVATFKSQIVGQLMHTREWSDWRNGEIWWLQSVFVLPEFRQQGIFRALYSHLETLAEQSTNVVGLRLYVEQSNRQAIETYGTLGLLNSGYTVMERMFEKNN